MTNIAIGDEFLETILTMNDYVDAVQEQIKKVFDDFDVLIKDHPWEVTYKTAFELQEKYNLEVLAEIQGNMEEWGDGEASYLALVQRFKMGEDAVAEAKRQQDEIVNKILEILPIEAISKQDFNNTHFDLEKVRDSLELIADYVQSSLPGTVEDYQSKLKKLSKDNEIVKSIVNIGILYGVSIKNFVTEAVKKIHELLNKYTTHMEAYMERAIDDEKDKVNTIVSNVEQSIGSMRDFIEDLFEDNSY